MISIAIADEQALLKPDSRRQRRAIRQILKDAGHTDAVISLAIVDDRTIHDLNRRFLQHDCPTDVISFALSEGTAGFEGEIVVSADTAERTARQLGWNAADELLLYVIHGALHLAGYDDLEPQYAEEMRRQERHYLSLFGLEPPEKASTTAKSKSRHLAVDTGRARR